uniref:Uncharacterized protein n=1 Tax=Anguilla anguilla TaxID=7936 RepID=A0A0E9UTS4_ANGAN
MSKLKKERNGQKLENKFAFIENGHS